MSRIWNALKEAEQDRARSQSGRSEPVSSTSLNVEHRKARRSKHNVTVLVYGLDSEKHPFHEDTETVDASSQGCSLLLETAVARGQRLYLVNTTSQDGQECRVVRMGKPHAGKRQVAVEFLRAAPKFWSDS